MPRTRCSTTEACGRRWACPAHQSAATTPRRPRPNQPLGCVVSPLRTSTSPPLAATLPSTCQRGGSCGRCPNAATPRTTASRSSAPPVAPPRAVFASRTGNGHSSRDTAQNSHERTTCCPPNDRTVAPSRNTQSMRRSSRHSSCTPLSPGPSSEVEPSATRQVSVPATRSRRRTEPASAKPGRRLRPRRRAPRRAARPGRRRRRTRRRCRARGCRPRGGRRAGSARRPGRADRAAATTRCCPARGVGCRGRRRRFGDLVALVDLDGEPVGGMHVDPPARRTRAACGLALEGGDSTADVVGPPEPCRRRGRTWTASTEARKGVHVRGALSFGDRT